MGNCLIKGHLGVHLAANSPQKRASKGEKSLAFPACAYRDSMPIALRPPMFHVKQFLQKTNFFAGNTAEISVKIPKYILGS